jgi:hypothetical protein
MICLFYLQKKIYSFYRIIKSYEIAGPKKVTDVHRHEFIKKRFKGIGKESIILSWLVSNAFHVLFYHISFSMVQNLLLFKLVYVIPFLILWKLLYYH